MRINANGGRCFQRPPFAFACWIYFFFAAAFFAVFLAAFLVAICLFSLSIKLRSCNTIVAANEGIDLAKNSVKKNR
jgi:hypothetical protein